MVEYSCHTSRGVASPRPKAYVGRRVYCEITYLQIEN